MTPKDHTSDCVENIRSRMDSMAIHFTGKTYNKYVYKNYFKRIQDVSKQLDARKFNLLFWCSDILQFDTYFLPGQSRKFSLYFLPLKEHFGQLNHRVKSGVVKRLVYKSL